MSLDYRLSGIPNFKELCYVPAGTDSEGKEMVRIHPVTESIIFYMMLTDTGWELTEKNADEFYKRMRLLDALNDPIFSNGQGEPTHITREQVNAHIGLGVNVAPVIRSKWIKRVTDNFMDREIIWRDKRTAERANAD